MQDNLELIIKDLYELDPTLLERDGEVRTIVAALLTHKPEVVTDTKFAQELRRKLLLSGSAGVVSISLPWQWWVARLVPLGAMATLLFMLLPLQTHDAALPQSIPEERPVTPGPGTVEVSPLGTERMQQPAPPTADSVMPTMPVAPVESAVMPDNSAAKMLLLPTASPATVPLQLLNKHRSEALQVIVNDLFGAAGFVVVRKLEDETLVSVVALSPYLRSEFTKPLTLGQQAELQVGAMYSVGIYSDNPDSLIDIGQFSPVSDPLMFEIRFFVGQTGALEIVS